MTLTVRSASVTGATTKGSALTHAEMDANWAHVIQSSNQAFAPSGTGATSRTVQAKLRERVSLEDFGAVGDGVTNDTAAWVAALSAVGASNFEIHGTPAKTYMINADGVLVSGKTNGHLIGHGSKIKALALTTQVSLIAGASVVKLLNCTDCVVEDFVLDGGGFAHDMVSLNTCTDCVVLNNTTANAGVHGVLNSYGSTRSAFISNVVKTPKSPAGCIRLGHYNADNQRDFEGLIANNRIDCGSVVSDGIVLGCLIGGAVIGNVQKNGFSGLVFSGATGRTTSFVTVSGNRFTGNIAHGIQWDVVTTPLADFPTGMAVHGNVCDGNTSSGFYCLHANGAAISGNTCINNGVNGITIDEVLNLAISGNLCADTRAGGARTQVTGIDIVADIGVEMVKNITLSGNICRNHTTYGIRVQTVVAETITNISITGNTCTDNGNGGIVVAEASSGAITGVVVTGNSCRGNTTTDLRVDPLDAVIHNNIYTLATGNTGSINFTNLDATPSVKGGRRHFRAINTGATVVTDLDDGVEGQEVTIESTTANTTIAHGTMRLNGNANFVMAANNMLTLVRHATVWREKARGTAN